MARRRTAEQSLPVAIVESPLLLGTNDAQRQAITHTTGPLLVVAGAGTGKTSVLTKRIAWLIEQGHAKPEQILALTFTDKAAGEMETRVDQLVPYGSFGATVTTFHSFGDQLLREHALDLGLPPEFRVLGSDEQRLFLEARFDQIDTLAELRPVANSRKFVEAVLSVISRAKDELVSAERYQHAAAQLVAAATTDDERREALRQSEIATIYTAYERFKADKGVIDFGDQLLLLDALFNQRSTVLATLQAKFRFILVDEFQDTNVAQYELVKRIAAGHHNLCVVGDDDQAIYKFRGAATSNILGFKRDYPDTATVVLRDNYRSTQAILDAAHTLIRHNDPDRLETQLGISKQLVGQSAGVPPRFVWYRHEADELDGLTAALGELRKTVPLHDIAILVRNNALVSSLTTALGTGGIPFSTSADRSFVALPEVRGVVAFFHALAHPTDSLAYIKLALSPFYDLDPAWLLPMNDLARANHQPLFDILADEGNEAWQRLSSEAKTALIGLRDDLTRYRRMIPDANPGQILYQFLKDRDAGRLRHLPEETRYEYNRNFGSLYEAIQGYVDAGNDLFPLAFVDQLDTLLANVVPPHVSLGPDADAIRIMTVHAAKGLEFDTVFLPFMTADRFPSRRRHEPLSLPAILIQETLAAGDEHLAEERRLAYVALTRAKHRLLMSGAAFTGAGKRAKKPSPFVLESLGLTSAPDPVERITPEARQNRFAPVLKRHTGSLTFPTRNGLVSLTPAMIDTYLRDPYDFFWKFVLKAPTAPSSHLSYGNAVHAAIEAYYLRRKEGQTPTSAEILRRFSEAWTNEGFASLEDANRRYRVGEQTVERFMVRAAAEPLPDFVEESFAITLPGVQIRGRMDAVFRATGEIRDFKTSQVKDQKDADSRAKDNIPIRIYTLAYQTRFGELPKQLTLDFVDATLRASIVPDDAMIESIKATIAEVADKIRAGEFPANPDNQFKEYE